MRLVGILLSISLSFLLLTPAQAKSSYSLPAFTQSAPQEWLNSKPLTKKDLLGKVTLVDFWSYGCWNCYRSFPWLHEVEAKNKAKGFQIIGIHSPEFESEKSHDRIKEKIKEFKVTNPVMVDNDMGFWRAMNNRYWPTYYIVDKKGFVRKSFIGETHKGSAQANKIENLIAKLLKE